MGDAAVDTHGIDHLVYERRWVILGVLCLSLVLVVAAVSSINVAIPSIRAQLHPTDTQLLWIVDIYAVVFAGLLLPAGALGDKFGRKGALQAGLSIFAVAVGAVQRGEQPQRVARVPLPDGHRRGADHAVDAVAADERVPAAGAPEGNRRVGRLRRCGRGDRHAARRVRPDPLLVRLGVLRVGADRRHRSRDGHVDLPDVEGAARGAARPVRCPALGRRLRIAALRHHRRPGARAGARSTASERSLCASSRSSASCCGSAAPPIRCSISASSPSAGSAPVRSASRSPSSRCSRCSS